MTTMSQPHLCLYFLSLLLLCFVYPSSFLMIIIPDEDFAACPSRQIQAFNQFKNEFDTSNCNNSDYSNGVWCNNSTGEVTMLRLKACLSGTLKPNSSLFRFHHLRYLSLSFNNFTYSSLPSEFGNLNKLVALDLSSCGFFGQIPSSFSNLTMLSVLNLSYNQLSGTLNPNSSIFELNHLRVLSLAFNNFNSPLPFAFGNLNNLEILHIASNGFFGQFPSSFSNLTQLTEMYLYENKFTGRFPLVQNLTKLSHIGLSDNQFSGAIPSSLLSMPFLKYLNLSDNHLTGYIEVTNFSSPSKIEYLYLDKNHFEGQILEPISKLINLKEVSLSFLNSSYPFDLNLLYSLKSLSAIDLSGNNISPASLRSGSLIPVTLRELHMANCKINVFPSVLKSLQNLEYINMSGNEMKGKIPKWLWSLPRLGFVQVPDNYFNGFEGSTNVLVNSSVRLLFLANNNFEGALPNLPVSIKVFSVRSSNFTGNIPLSICNRSSLGSLDLSYNNFTGPIPQCLNNIAILNLRMNNLEGHIPDAFHVGASLQTLDVGYNQLTGKLPRSLLNCSSLKFLSVVNNKIKDTFPLWLKKLPNLQVLILRSNKFYGPISSPHQGPLGFPELRIFEIADNKFSGSLPPNYFFKWKALSLTMNEGCGLYMSSDKRKFAGEVYYYYLDGIDLQYKGLSMENQIVLTSYSTIDLSGNLLEGQIPESIGLLKALIALNLSNNAFTGHIPLSLSNLKELESLDLSGNQLSGTIPNGLGTLSFLAYINVSHNQLEGEIPQGPQITGQPKSSFEGNARLCGLPLEETCFGSNTPPTHHLEEDEEDEEEQVLNWKGVTIGYGSGVLVGLAIAQVIASYKPEWLAKIICLNKRKHRQYYSSSS